MNEQAPRDDNRIPSLLGKDNVTGFTRAALIDNSTGRLLTATTATISAQEYMDGEVDLTPTGGLVMGYETATNTVRAVRVDANGNLQISLSITEVAVTGPDADGDLSTENPVLTAGEDSSGRVRTIRVDSNGLISIAQQSAASDGDTNAIGFIQDEAGASRKLAISPYMYNGTTWDRLRGTAADGLLVNLGSNNDVSITGTPNVAVTNTPSVTVSGVVNVESNGTGLGNGQVLVNTTSTTIVAASADRQGVTITNQGNEDVYVGTGVVTTSNGFLLEPGESIAMPTDSQVTGITSAGSTTIGYLSFS